MKAIYESSLSLIGDTPLVSLNRIHSEPARLLAKVEFFNPGGSIKDRPARHIIQTAYNQGKLVPGQPVVEMTSGNMGAGLAVVCSITGNPFVAVMSEGNSPARSRMISSFGAEVVLVPQVDGSPERVTGADIAFAREKALEIAHKRNAFFVDQFNNPSSVLVHEQETGPEIWEALDGQIDCFVAGIGSGGTFVGVSRFLKSRKPEITCVAVEPKGAEVLAGKNVVKARHVLQGVGYGSIPPKWENRLADLFVAVSDEEAIRYQKLLAEKEGLYVGYSSAANVCAGIKIMKNKTFETVPTIVTFLCDTGLKY